MEKKKTILLIFLLVLALFACICLFCLMLGKDILSWQTLMRNFLYNSPFFGVMGVMDYAVFHYLKRESDGYSISYIKGLLVALVGTPTLLAVLCVPMSAILPVNLSFRYNILPATLCNSIITLFIGIFLYDKQQADNQQQMLKMERDKLRYQFEALKNQINPHFLFNSLNVLASLAYHDADKTNLFAKKLAEVYRYLIVTRDRQTVELAEELQFVEAYLYLERIRFGKALQVTITDNHTCKMVSVIPASLQMLVENAVKHNISTLKSPLQIHIAIDDKVVRVSNNLQLRSYTIKNGVGLENLRRQYRLQGKDIFVTKSDTEFVVELPFI